MGWTRQARVAAVAATVVLMLVAVPATAAAAVRGSTAEGCRGVLSSYRADSSFVDLALVPGPDGTQRDPFRIDPDGFIAWGGAPDSDIRSGAWSISVMGLDMAHGTVDAAHRGLVAAGVLYPAQDTAPGAAAQPVGAVATWALRGSAYFPVTFTVEGATATCTATVWVGGVGEGTSTPLFWAALLLGALGVIVTVAMLATTRAHTVIDLRVPAGIHPIRQSGEPATRRSSR